MSKIKSVDESVFWDLVSKSNWAADYSYMRIKIELIKALTPEARQEFVDVFSKMTENLSKAIDKYCEEHNTSTGCGDDSFSDLVAHIVGLGKTEFEQVMSDPSLAVKRAKHGQYSESFAYSVPNRFDDDSLSKSNYISKAKKFLEDEGIVEFISLPENKKEALGVLNDTNVAKNVSKIISILQQVSAGNLSPLEVEGFEVNSVGYSSVESNELYQAWNSVTKILNLHYGIPNLIIDYNRYRDIID